MKMNLLNYWELLRKMIKIITIISILISSSVYADPIKVGVIDTGLNIKDTRFTKHICPVGHADFTGKGLNDNHGHGTHVAGLIQKYAGDADFCFVILKYYENDNTPANINLMRINSALLHAQKLNLRIVNMSYSGFNYDDNEYGLMLNLTIMSKTILSVAAGNEGLDLDKECNQYPACYNISNMHVVGSLNGGYDKSMFSNYGKKVQYWEQNTHFSTLPNDTNGYLSGTSQATAVHTGKLIKEIYENKTY